MLSLQISKACFSNFQLTKCCFKSHVKILLHAWSLLPSCLQQLMHYFTLRIISITHHSVQGILLQVRPRSDLSCPVCLSIHKLLPCIQLLRNKVSQFIIIWCASSLGQALLDVIRLHHLVTLTLLTLKGISLQFRTYQV